ncbi:hypothetical protein CHELA1G11_20830 [Hyphomicrobiales bacterium]|nr:hypothetical protein CHELA1G11_20830 [Hyphomicrobiales bacterium]CAH1692154.1 hypothetical protein CHELA1G2_21146 [Hyphomicrobiales bacterium]
MQAPVTGKWPMDETSIKVRGQWLYLYRASDTVAFGLSEHRDLPAAKRFLRKAFARHGRPDRIVTDLVRSALSRRIGARLPTDPAERNRRLLVLELEWDTSASDVAGSAISRLRQLPAII